MSKTRRTVETARKNVSLSDMYPNIKPQKMKITIKSTESLPVTKSGKLRECRECKYSNRDCTFCSLLNKMIFPYQYACFSFITDEEDEERRREAAIKNAAEVTAKWRKIQAIEEQKCNWMLTLMLDMIVGSQILLEDFERRTDQMLKNNPFPTVKDKANHKSDKDLIFKHKYAFAGIKKTYDSMKDRLAECCSKIRTIFEDTIQKHIVGMCTEPDGSFNEQKYSSVDVNAAEFLRLMMLVMNKSVGHDGNFEKIVDFIAQLDGEDVFTPQDISRFKIK